MTRMGDSRLSNSIRNADRPGYIGEVLRPRWDLHGWSVRSPCEKLTFTSNSYHGVPIGRSISE
jgi:hypothetical protein